MLPYSPNRVYSGAVPVVPGDLQDLQECIVRGAHGIVPLLLAPHAFASKGGTGSLLTERWVGSDIYYSELRAIAGCRLHSIVFGHDRGGAGTIEFHARRFNITTDVTSSVLLASVATGSGYTTTPVDEAAIIAALGWSTLPANEAVILEVICSHAANKFGGAVVEISKP